MDVAASVARQTVIRYDQGGDEHYDLLSAFQKSMRGSDPNAAVHYLARILEAGDLPSAARRLMVCACEDVGLAYPQIIPIEQEFVGEFVRLLFLFVLFRFGLVYATFIDFDIPVFDYMTQFME